MSFIGYNTFVTNRKGVPAIMRDVTANQPTVGYDGLIFIDTQAQTISIWLGGAWILLASGTGSAQDLEQVTQVGNSTEQGIEFLNNLTLPSENRMMRLYMNGAEGRIQCWDWRPGFEGPIPFVVESSEIKLQGSDQVELSSTGGSVVLSPGENQNIFIIIKEPSIVQSGGRITYAADFSADYDDRTLVDKQYADNAGTASNGLSKVPGGPVILGGSLSQNTVIDYNASIFLIGNVTAPLQQPYLQFSASSRNGTIGRTNAAGVGVQWLRFDGTQSDKIEIGDQTNNRGVEYAADYSANFTSRSLPDTAYVLNQIANFTIANGLTRVGGAVAWGGALTTGTTLNTGTQGLFIGRTTVANGTQIQITAAGLQLSIGRFNAGNVLQQGLQFITGTNLLLITDITNAKGLEYAADYKANYTARSIPDKGYVDGGMVTTTNTIVGNNVTTAYTFNHNAAFTPSNILLTPSTAPVDIGGGNSQSIIPFCFITNITATQFTINITPTIVPAFNGASQTFICTAIR